MSTIVPGAGERPVVADLIIGKGADKQIAFAHVRQRSLHVQWRARKGIDHRSGEIWRMATPEVQHRAAVLAARAVPVEWIAVEPIRQLLPHESGMPIGRRLARIEAGWTVSCRPHDDESPQRTGRRDRDPSPP